MKGKKIILLLLLVAMVVSTGGILAGTNEAAINNIDTGVVNIEITEYMLDANGKEVPWVNNPKVTPNMTVSKIPYFTATGNSCYIRATVEVDQDLKTDELITIDSLRGISNDWVRVGDYYYYKYPLNTNESVDFFHGVKVPNWGNEVNVGYWNVDITVKVDAIQSENFIPDFSSVSPWGDVVIQESIHKDGYDINTFTSNTDIDILVNIVDKDEIVIEPEDFFSGFKTMVPGDTLSDTVKLKVDRKSRVYFYAEPLVDVDLLEKITWKMVLTKRGEETVLHEGTLADTVDRLLIGRFTRGEEAEITFTIHMPVELDNQYTLRNGSVKWSFDMVRIYNPPVEEPEDPVEPDNPVEPEDPNNPEKPGEQDKPVKPDEPNKPEKPGKEDKPAKGDKGDIQTGIGSYMGIYIGVLIISTILVIILVVTDRRKKKEVE